MPRKGIQLAYPFDEWRFAKWGSEALLQPKLDGERCRALISRDGVKLLSSEENLICSVPHVNTALRIAFSTNSDYVLELDGELYLPGSYQNTLHGIVSRTANLHPDYEIVEYHIFDIIDQHLQLQRLAQLRSYKSNLHKLWKDSKLSNTLHIVDTHYVQSLDEIWSHLDDIVSMGEEGFILRQLNGRYKRSRSTEMMKFKPKKSDYYLIVGSLEAISKDGKPKGELGALICESDGDVFNVACGRTIDQDKKRWLWQHRELLPGNFCHVEYQHLFPRTKRPRSGRFTDVVDPMTLKSIVKN